MNQILKTMKTKRIILIGTLFVAGLLLQIPKSTQGQMIVEISGGAGFSFMDPEVWTGYPTNTYFNGKTLHDHSHLMYQGYLQFFPLNFSSRLAIGVEGGWQNYLSYELKIKENIEFKNFYEDERIAAWRALVVVRGYLVQRFFAEVGGGAYFFSGYTRGGCEATLGYEIKLSETFYLPVKVRSDFIFNSGSNIIVPGATVGLAIHLGGKK